MSRHQIDVVKCLKQPGSFYGFLCAKCDGKCCLCDSLVHPTELVNICDECHFGPKQNCCILCGDKGKGKGESEHKAYYCRECVLLEYSRNGCPTNLFMGFNENDRKMEKKRYKETTEGKEETKKFSDMMQE